MTLRQKSRACLGFRYTKLPWFILSENKLNYLVKHKATENWGKMYIGRGGAKKYKNKQTNKTQVGRDSDI